MARMSNQERRKKLLQLLRSADNKRCGDCEMFLAEYASINACIAFGVFICTNCMVAHQQIHKNVDVCIHHHNWSEKEVDAMEKAGNKYVNQVYERYVPPTWNKPGPEADADERIWWIEAKYLHRYFMIPDYAHQRSPNKRKKRQRTMMMGKAMPPLPIRLVDFFLVCGLDPASVPLPTDSCPPDIVLKDAPTTQRTDANKHLTKHKRRIPREVKLEASVLDCFPEKDAHEDCPFPRGVCEFIFPSGLQPLIAEKEPTLFSFVLTDAFGVKMHGVCLHIYEEVDLSRPKYANLLRQFWDGDETELDNAKVYIPKALTILSHYPFYNAFSTFLRQLYRISISIAPMPIERYVSNFVCEVSLPPQGKTEVVYALPGRTLTLSRPPRNRPPMTDFSFQALFSFLSIDNILTIFACLLIEAKVAIVSSHYALLTPACEALQTLLFPFSCQGSFIPLLPASMSGCLEAPFPFLVGLHSSSLHLLSSGRNRRPSGVTYVDLDNNQVSIGHDDENNNVSVLDSLPERAKQELFKQLRFALETHVGSVLYERKQVQLDRVDYAFMSNPSPILIDEFATEKGYTQVKHELDDIPDTPRSASHLLYGLADQNAQEVMDVHIKQIREAFINFLSTLFQDFKAYVNAPSEQSSSKDALFNREAFLSQTTSPLINLQNREYILLILQTQMFERFLEEYISNVKTPEFQHFEYLVGIKQKKVRRNRLSTPSKETHVQIQTWFGSDQDEKNIKQHNPPQPQAWDLQQGKTYNYASFPRLQKELFGTLRSPTILAINQPQETRLEGKKTA